VIFAIFGASEGVTRVPGGGSVPSGDDVRITIQPSPVFFGSVMVPAYVAPASSVIVSPGFAALMAA
jgi:hypothetical protein